MFPACGTLQVEKRVLHMRTLCKAQTTLKYGSQVWVIEKGNTSMLEVAQKRFLLPVLGIEAHITRQEDLTIT